MADLHILREHTLKGMEGRAVALSSRMLPDDCFPLIHSGRGAFAPAGSILVAHGGMSLDEMVVPRVQVTRMNPK